MSDAAIAQSRETIKAGSKSFAAASALFDRRTREGAWALYAWCRHCDDVIDGQALGGELTAVSDPAERLAELRRQTLAALRTDAPVEPAFEAFRRVARAHDLGARYPLELLEGFAMDVEARSYRTLQDTLLYSYHVAGVVGVMMAKVMGVSDKPMLDRACDLGLAFQLTNICRDVMEDARAGRVYLPGDWLKAEGVTPIPQGVLAPEARAGVHRVATRLLEEADLYYRSSRLGIARLPLRAAWAIAAARDIYREIGRVVRRRSVRAWDTRAGAGSALKVALLVRGGSLALADRVAPPRNDRTGLWTMPD